MLRAVINNEYSFNIVSYYDQLSLLNTTPSTVLQAFSMQSIDNINIDFKPLFEKNSVFNIQIFNSFDECIFQTTNYSSIIEVSSASTTSVENAAKEINSTTIRFMPKTPIEDEIIDE